MVFRAEQQEIPQVKSLRQAQGKPLLKKKPKRKRLSKQGRWLVLAILILTVLASFGFYIKPGLPKLKEKFFSPLIITSVPKEERFNPEPVLDEIRGLTKNLLGTYGVYVYQLTDGHEYGLRQTETFPAASLMKLPVMLLVYQEAEEGKLELDKYRELARMMGKRSDNVAYNKLVAYFGREKIQALINSLGMEKTAIAKDDTAPADVGLLFRKLFEGKLVNQVNQGELLSFLTDTIFEDRIPAGVPEGVRVAHKIGTEIGVFSDAGIVFSQQPFILVIMSKNAKESEAIQVLPKIAKAVYGFETK